ASSSVTPLVVSLRNQGDLCGNASACLHHNYMQDLSAVIRKSSDTCAEPHRNTNGISPGHSEVGSNNARVLVWWRVLGQCNNLVFPHRALRTDDGQFFQTTGTLVEQIA
ncbi:MAG: hypothetical protein ACKPKO_03965, partial [Candidatus Fonsibacter sp.]